MTSVGPRRRQRAKQRRRRRGQRRDAHGRAGHGVLLDGGARLGEAGEGAEGRGGARPRCGQRPAQGVNRPGVYELGDGRVQRGREPRHVRRVERGRGLIRGLHARMGGHAYFPRKFSDSARGSQTCLKDGSVITKPSFELIKSLLYRRV